MRRKVIMVATPSRGIVSMWWCRQMLNLVRPLNIGIKFAFVQDDGERPQIAEARNKLVADAFAVCDERTEVDSIFWVDDDVLVSPGALLALYNHHVPMASGVYFTKCELPEPLIFPSRLGGTAKFNADEIIKDCWGHGMGLTLVKLSVYGHMLREEVITAKDAHGNWEFYKTDQEYRVEDGMLDCGGTEDLYFCQKAREAGIPSVVDCSKHAFGWHYELATGKGYPLKQFAAYRKAQPIEWDNGVTWQ